MDLQTGWDFNREDHRKAADRYVIEQEPKLVIGGPMCTMFSQLQAMTPWAEAKHKEWKEARKHLQFVMKLYEKQMVGGRCFCTSTRRGPGHGS